MHSQNSVMEVARLRLQVQMNNRFRLELQATLSKVFREHGVAVSDELLAALILSVPEELIGQGDAQKVSAQTGQRYDMSADYGQPPQPPRFINPSPPPPDPPPIDPPPIDPPPIDPPPIDPPPVDPPS